jgi:hypothetical protein
VGDLSLAIPKLRQGSFFPDWLEPCRRVDKALYAVVMEAYTGGISTRKVDALVEAQGGASGISKSDVSRICQGLDERSNLYWAGRWSMPASPTSTSTPPPSTAAWAATSRWSHGRSW